jgi:hypothetical protein
MLPKSADRAVNVFIKNLEDLNLIDNNRFKFLLPASQVNKSIAEVKSDEPDKTERIPGINRNQDLSEGDLFKLPIPLRDNPIAYLIYPKEQITKKDIGVIKLQLAVIEATLKDSDEKIEGG